MSWTKQKSAAILRQLRDITDLVEQLDHGVCQLEAKQLAILTAPYAKKERSKYILTNSELIILFYGLNVAMRVEANYLTAMNNSTADSIKSALREIEDIVKTDMEGAVDSKELIKEFLKVLRNSIRVLQEYRLIQQSYVDELNKRISVSPMSNFKSGQKLVQSNNQHPFERLTKFLRSTCICY